MNIEIIKNHVKNVLRGTDFKNLGQRITGKVRDIYVGEKEVTLVATDRHSSFDRIIAHIPFKGEVLNQISAFWFGKTKDIIPNHVISLPDPNVLIAKKCEVIPIECVVRGYITGTTSTSLWTNYKKGQRDFGDFVLPDGLRKNQKLSEPLFTPTTKSDDHDVPITMKEIVEQGILSKEMAEKLEATAKALFVRGQEIALEKNWILVDTKYEFGIDENGELTLIDEIHTPDSSRYWIADTYEERFIANEEPENFDKEFIRKWVAEQCDPYTVEVIPEIPEDMVAELARRYIHIYESITGQKFEHDFSISTIDRIKNNLNLV